MDLGVCCFGETPTGDFVTVNPNPNSWTSEMDALLHDCLHRQNLNIGLSSKIPLKFIMFHRYRFQHHIKNGYGRSMTLVSPLAVQQWPLIVRMHRELS